MLFLSISIFAFALTWLLYFMTPFIAFIVLTALTICTAAQLFYKAQLLPETGMKTMDRAQGFKVVNPKRFKTVPADAPTKRTNAPTDEPTHQRTSAPAGDASVQRTNAPTAEPEHRKTGTPEHRNTDQSPDQSPGEAVKRQSGEPGDETVNRHTGTPAHRHTDTPGDTPAHRPNEMDQGGPSQADESQENQIETLAREKGIAIRVDNDVNFSEEELQNIAGQVEGLADLFGKLVVVEKDGNWTVVPEED